MIKARIAVGVALVACMFGASVATSYASDFRAFTKAGTEINGKVPTKQVGSGATEITVSKVTIKCETVKGVGRNEHPSAVLWYATTYTSCSEPAAKEVPVEVKSAGCETGFFTNNTLAINCGTGSLVVTVGTCTVKIPTQEGLEKVTYSPLGEKSPTITSTVLAKGKETNSCGLEGNAEVKGKGIVEPEESGVTLEIK
jgi:hypothetical protein